MSVQCDCGKWYADQEGAVLCRANRHGNGKYNCMDKYTFEHTLELQIKNECAECGEYLTSKRIERGGDIVFQIRPHRCQIDAPEDDSDEPQIREALADIKEIADAITDRNNKEIEKLKGEL